MNQDRIEQQLDAIRPGHRETDARQPELAEAAEKLLADPAVAAALARSEQLDQLIQEALEDLPVPSGLASQLEQAVLGGDGSAMDGDAALDANAATVPDSPEATGTRRNWFRWWTVAAAAAAAACFGGFILIQMSGPAPVTSAELVQQAHQWALQWQQDSAQRWRDDMPPANRPIAATVNMPFSTPWRSETLLGDSHAVVFRTATAMLIVLDAPQVKDLGAVPPKQPQFGTGSQRIGAWRTDGLVYVLVVRGDLLRYQSMLQRPFDA